MKLFLLICLVFLNGCFYPHRCNCNQDIYSDPYDYEEVDTQEETTYKAPKKRFFTNIDTQ